MFYASLTFGCIFASAVALAASQCSNPVDISGTVWAVSRITLNATGNYSNPVTDVHLQASFTLNTGAGITLNRTGFWNGGSVFEVRFAPTQAGVWSFSTVSNDPGLITCGVVNATAYDAATDVNRVNPVYVHGFLRVSSDKRRMEHADGTPFWWLGDTHWMGFDFEHLDDCNAPDPSCTSQWSYVLADRLRKGFTVWQTYFHGDTAMWWSDPGTWTRLAPENFTQRMDVMMDALAAEGVVVALGMGLHYMAVEMPPESLAMLGRYVSARYGSHPVVWITAQEVNAPNSNATNWAVAAQALAEDDAGSYAHPLSAHMWVFQNASTSAEPTTYAAEPWHSWFATQGGHTGMGIRPQSHYQFYYDFDAPAQPFLEAEAMYEEIICGPRFAFANDTRRAAYKSLLCGSLGYTYGAAAVWLFKWDLNDTTGDKYNPNTWWYPGMMLPGSTQMGYMTDLFTSLQWWQLTPRFSSSKWCDFVDAEETVLATISNSAYIVYAYGVGSTLGTLLQLNTTATYTATWFDPRMGLYMSLGNVTAPTGNFTLPGKPSTDDWVFLLQQILF